MKERIASLEKELDTLYAENKKMRSDFKYT